MGVLEELENATAGVADRVGPAVVGIGAGWGLGSGVVVADGVVLTNAHNVSDPGVTLIFADGRSVQGQVSGHDIDGDLATIAVDTAGDLPEVDLALSTNVYDCAVFDRMLPAGVIGNPQATPRCSRAAVRADRRCEPHARPRRRDRGRPAPPADPRGTPRCRARPAHRPERRPP